MTSSRAKQSSSKTQAEQNWGVRAKEGEQVSVESWEKALGDVRHSSGETPPGIWHKVLVFLMLEGHGTDGAIPKLMREQKYLPSGDRMGELGMSRKGFVEISRV